MLCKATYIKKANLIKVISNEVGYLLKPVLGLETDKCICQSDLVPAWRKLRDSSCLSQQSSH